MSRRVQSEAEIAAEADAAAAKNPLDAWHRSRPEERAEIVGNSRNFRANLTDWLDRMGFSSVDDYLAVVNELYAEYPHLRDDSDGPVLRRAAVVRPEQTTWAWAGRLPARSLSLLVGNPGEGKTLIALELIARASRGQLDGDLGTASSLYLSAEDSPATTLVPRLIAAGADLDLIHFLTMRREGVEDGLTLPDDTAALGDAIAKTGARVIVIDPVMAHVNGRVDAHRDHSLRRALAPLARIAADHNVVALGIAHLNKAQVSTLLARVGGSIALTAASRSVLLAGAKDGERVLIHGKCNVAPLAETLRFEIEERRIDVRDETIVTAGIVWRGEAPGVRAEDVLGPAADPSRMDEAMDFLRDLLAGGPIPSQDVPRLARDAGVTKATLLRAKKDLGVRSVRPEGFTGPWSWALPAAVHSQETPYVLTPGSENVHGSVRTYTAEESPPDLGLADVPDSRQERPEAPVAPVCSCGKPKVHTPAGRWVCTNPTHPIREVSA